MSNTNTCPTWVCIGVHNEGKGKRTCFWCLRQRRSVWHMEKKREGVWWHRDGCSAVMKGHIRASRGESGWRGEGRHKQHVTTYSTAVLLSQRK